MDSECYSTKHAAVFDYGILEEFFFARHSHTTFVSTQNKIKMLMLSFEPEVAEAEKKSGIWHSGHWSVKKPIISMLLKLI